MYEITVKRDCNYDYQMVVKENEAKTHGFNYVFARKHEDVLKVYEEVTGAKLLNDTYRDGCWVDSKNNDVLIVDEDQGVYDVAATVANLMVSLTEEEQKKVWCTITSIWE